MRTFNNEPEVKTFLAGRARDVWRVLFAAEAGQCTADEGAKLLGLDADSFGWLRTVALDSLRHVADAVRYTPSTTPRAS